MRSWKELKKEYGMLWELTDPVLCSVWIERDALQEKLDKIQGIVDGDFHSDVVKTVLIQEGFEE